VEKIAHVPITAPAVAKVVAATEKPRKQDVVIPTANVIHADVPRERATVLRASKK